MTFPTPEDKLAFLNDAHDYFDKSWREQAKSAHPDKGRILGLERTIALALQELVEIHTT